MLEDTGKPVAIDLVINQAALHGLLTRVRALGMSLLSVNCVNLYRTDGSIVKSEERR